MAQLVISPNVVIGVYDGKYCISSGGQPDRQVFLDDASSLNWLIRFAVPTDEDIVLAETIVDKHDAVARTISEFKEKRILLTVTSGKTADEPNRAQKDVGVAMTQLGALANVVYLVAGDMKAFGPHASSQLESATGISLQTRVSSLLAGAMSLQQELRQLREEYVTRQLDELNITGTTTNLKLNLGAGKKRLESWVNIDLHPAELAVDLRWGLPFGDGAADYVYMSHLLEHFYYPAEATTVLEEIRRVLVPGGVFRVVVPDIEKSIQAYVQEDDVFFESRKQYRPKWNARTKLEGFLSYAGAGPVPSSFMGSHKYGYDFETLEYVLRKVGFHSVVRSQFMQSRHECLNIDDASKVAGEQFGEQQYSLFVEAS